MSSSTTAPGVSIADVAVAKILLHAAKFPACHIGGYLLGSEHSISDILPIVHGYPVGSVLEIGASVANSSKRIIGYYYAPDILPSSSSSSSDNTPAYIPKLLDDIQAVSGDPPQSHPVLISLNCLQLQSSTINNTLETFVNYKRAVVTITGEQSTGYYKGLLTASNIAQFADLESHVDSKGGAADFSNKYLVGVLSR